MKIYYLLRQRLNQIERFLFRFRIDFCGGALSTVRKLRDDRPLHYLAVANAASEKTIRVKRSTLGRSMFSFLSVFVTQTVGLRAS